MAVKLPAARTTFLRAVQEFPRWMSIRKRPEKAVSGLYLESVIDEQTDIVAELNTFIKEFFLITYVGKESEIADYVYIVQVGSVDVAESVVTHPELELTVDAKFWLDNQDSYALYQEGYIIISAANLPDDKTLLYEYNGYKYGGKLSRYHIWNIFDEFAMFLGLERFTDDGETNAELLKRCFLVFQNPANSTRNGLQNTIMNCVSNNVKLEREELKIEIPDSENVWLPDEQYGTVYERLAQLNRDIYRTKVWGMSQWEHAFKKLEYLPHQWDKALEVYQDGTGQMGDLSVSLSQNEEDTTDVTVLGFKRDQASINEYFHHQNIRGEIGLQLKKFSDVLKPKHVQYKITATPAVKIAPESIYILEQSIVEGMNKFYLQDIVTNSGSVKVVNQGELEANKTYELVFRSNGDYSDMAVRKIDLVSDSGTTNLIEESRTMKLSDGVLKHVDVKRHVTKISELKSYNNIVNTPDGMTLGKGGQTGTFTIDVTGCGGQVLRVDSYGEMFDVTEQSDMWTLNGLKINGDKELFSDSREAADETATLEMDCMGYTYTLKKADNQGAMNVRVFVDGKINTSLSGLLTTPDEPVTKTFDKMTHVKIVFTKSGEYPVTIKDIKATKYEITYKLTYGSVTQGPVSAYMSDVPATRQNTLLVTVKSYDVVAPVIRFIHIGPSTKRTSYTVKNISSTTTGTYLDIDTDCLVSLYETSGSSRKLVSDNFITKKYYENTSVDDVQYLEINTNSFTQILSSSKRISKTVRNGKTVSYITLNPGEKISQISINGTTYVTRARRSIRDIMGWEARHNVYIAKNAKGFIVRDTVSGEEWLTFISRRNFTDANTFTYENLPEGAIGHFYVNRDEDVVTIANSTDRNFEDTFISMQASQEYVAYNEINMYKPVVGDTENLTISNTFTPILDMNQLMFYTISEIESSDNTLSATAVFKKYRYSRSNYFGFPSECRKRIKSILSLLESGTSRSKVEAALSDLNSIYGINIAYSAQLDTRLREILNDGIWSLGQKEIYIATDFDFNNSNTYDASVSSVSTVFSISNEIDLPETMTVGDGEVNLSEYIVTPPSNMKVIFGKTGEEIENNLIVNEDGFNKLKYSNVSRIQALYVNGVEYNNYTLLKEEGIIVWNDVTELMKREDDDNNIVGEFFQVAYEYGIPTSIKYNDLSYLYDMISYTVEAYLPVEVVSKIPKGLKDGESFIVEFASAVDYVPQPSCSNSNFVATYQNGTVSVQRLYLDNVAIIQAGYYYDDDDEYYYYNHDYYNEIDRFGNITFHNVKKLDVMFQFLMASSNYLLNTDFLDGENYEKLCYVNFDDKRVESSGISKLNLVTACDNYNTWRSFNMVVTFVDGINGIGMLFSPDDDNAYAVMDLTRYLIPGGLVTLFATNDIKLDIFREIKASGDSMIKSVFAEPFASFESVDNFMGWQIPEDIDTSYKYFLVVRGNGVIDDIIVRDNVSIEDQFSLHVKNVDNMDFDIEEREVSGYEQRLAFDRDGCNLDFLEITRDDVVQIGSNVDYGITKIYEMADDYDSFTASTTVTRRKGMFITGDKSGKIKTPLFYVENNANIVELYVKINNLLIDGMKYFTVNAFVADNTDSPVRAVGMVQKTNLASFVGSQIGSYIQFEIEIDRNKIIDSVEVYARYAETGLQPLRVEDYREGSIVTKVYDTGSVNSYKFKRLDGEVEQNRYFTLSVRGCKQDSVNMVWTDWYTVSLDANLNAIGYPHVFDGYRLFQFKMDFSNSRVKADIKNFVLEVV